MQSKAIIDSIRALGIVILIGGFLVGGYFLFAAMGASGSSANTAGVGLLFALGVLSIFVGAFLWAMCMGIALIASSVLDGLDILEKRLPKLEGRQGSYSNRGNESKSSEADSSLIPTTISVYKPLGDSQAQRSRVRHIQPGDK